MEDFYKPKLFYADITQNLNFVLCDKVMFCNNTTYFMVANGNTILPALQVYLNSKLIDWYYRTLSVQLGEKAVRMFSIYVLNIPIPKSLEEDVYEAYHLTNEEIDYIENRE
jgi:adenine-specific DNA-methyltransferase